MNKELDAADFGKIRKKLVKQKDSLEKNKSELIRVQDLYKSVDYQKRIVDSLQVRTTQLEYLLNEVKSFYRDQALRDIRSAKCPSIECATMKKSYERNFTLFLEKNNLKKELENTKALARTDGSVNFLLAKRLEKIGQKITSVESAITNKESALKKHDASVDEFDITNLNIGNSYVTQLEELDNKKLAAYDINEFSWISIGAKFMRNQFKLYDPNEPLEDQLQDESFSRGELTFQFSHYNKTPFSKLNTIYSSFGISMRYINNLADLTKVMLTDESTVGQSQEVSRVISKDITTFQGAYQEDLSELFVYGDFYYFLSRQGFASLHWNPNVSIREGRKAVWNMDIGLVLSFKNPKEKNALVNTELFFRLKDLGNTTGSDLRLFERNTLGLRLTVPLKFNLR